MVSKFSIFFLKYKFQIGAAILLFTTLASLTFLVKTSLENQQKELTAVSNEQKIASLSAQVKSLLKVNNQLQNEDTRATLTTINNTIEKYETVKNKSADYKNQGVDTASVDSQFPTAVDLILQKKYSEADALLTKLDTDLETALKAKQAADAAKPKTTTTTTTSTCSSVPTSGYCQLSVKVGSTSFSVYLVAGNVSSVWTDTANSDNCADNCPTKALASYVSADGGYAGINGTYFCPPDYSSCAGKVSSFDFPVYNSNLKKWINEDKLAWTNRAMMAFTSSSAVFYPTANSYSGLGGIKAGIVNFPGLLQNGQNIVGNYTLTSAQQTKGNRGGVGVKGSTVYLVITKSATVNDLAEIMKSMGISNALNLDGGGSSALYYNGSYKVGPGRALPNALILK